MKKLRALHAGDGTGSQRPSIRYVTEAVRRVYQQAGTNEIDTLSEIVTALEANGEKPLTWDGYSWAGLTDEDAAHAHACENVRRYFHRIATRIDGRLVRLFQCIVIKDALPTGQYYRRGKHKGEEKRRKTLQRKWVNIADLLITRTRPSDDRWQDMERRLQTRDDLALIRNSLAELRDGISVKLAGVDGVIKLVGDGFIFQPSMFGFNETSDVA